MRRSLPLLLTLAAALAPAGCGGGGADAPPLSAADRYRSALGQQCVDAQLDRETITKPAQPTSAALAAYLAANLKVARRAQREAERLRPPPELAAEHRRGRRLARETTRLLAEALRKTRSSRVPDPVVRRLEPALNARIRQGNRLAEALGTPQCRQEPLELTFAP